MSMQEQIPQALGLRLDNSLVSNAFGFLRQPLNFVPYYQENAEVVVTGVPFDLATSGRSGARLGPQAIRAASTHLAWEHTRFPWDFEVTEALNIIDCGDLVYDFGSAQDFTSKLQNHIHDLLAFNKLPLTLGGDHFITLPILRAMAAKYGKVALLHFDAHTDTYEQGSECDHGTMFYHAIKEGLIDPEHSLQVGIRTAYEPTAMQVLDAPYCNDLSGKEIAELIKARVGSFPVYLTFDIDCLDPAFAPGTGTPVIGGLSSDKVLKILRNLVGLNFAGFDVVEVCPPCDHSEITALAAATLALEMLCLYAASRR